MLATALTAFFFFASVQCLLVVQVADKLTPGGAKHDNATRPAGGQAQYA